MISPGRLPSHSLTAALVAAVSVSLPNVASAQLDDFAAIPIVAPTTKLEHSVQFVIDGNVLKGFSGLTRKWSSITGIAGPPSATISNEHFVAQDGLVFYGFSMRSSAFAALLPLSGNATLLTNGSAQSWQSVVVDGNTVHMYSAITGQWTSHTFASPPIVNTSGRLCVIVDDGTTLWGMSPYYGSAIPLNVAGATVVGGFGSAFIATSPGEVHGFSGHLNTWASMPVASTPAVINPFTSQPGYAVINDGTAISFYSGQTGTFTTLPASPSASLNMHRTCTIAVDGTTAYAYSSLRGGFQALTFATPPTVNVSHFFGIVADGSNTYGYSCEDNAFSAPLPGDYSYTLTQTSASATPVAASAPTDVYSAVSNQWIPVPIVATDSRVSANGIVVFEPNTGMWGFSPNLSTWSNFAISLPDQYIQASTPQGLGLLVMRLGQDLFTFNHVSGEWRSITTAAPILTTKSHWGCAVLQDGINAYAFGAFNDRWSTMPIAGSAVVNAQVESASVNDGTQIYGYTAFGQILSSADYPDYFRAVGIGGKFRLDLVGEASAPTILLLGFAPAALPTGFGTLLIDPTNLLIIAQPWLNAGGQFDMWLSVPNSPFYSGLDAHFQAAILGPNGLYLTNSAVARIR